MENKFSMTLEENIFLAKRNIIDYIWKSAKLEGLSVTFPDTEAIYNNCNVSNVKADEIVAVNNLKHAWQFILDNIEYEIDYPYICKINQYVGSNLFMNAGFIRNIPVSIGGTTWKPDMPIEFVIREEIEDTCNIENPTERAITLMLRLMRKQVFLDGNKRTAMLAANQIMISNGVGIISVPVELQYEFTKLLINYYETNDMSYIKEFVYHNCIDGVELVKINNENQTYNPNNDFYLKVSATEAQMLKDNDIAYCGKINPDKINVIRISVDDKTKAENLINSVRNNITLKP